MNFGKLGWFLVSLVLVLSKVLEGFVYRCFDKYDDLSCRAKHKTIFKNYGKKIIVSLMVGLISFLIRYAFLEMFGLHWFSANIYLHIINANTSFVFERKLGYQSNDGLAKNYLRKLLSMLFAASISTLLWWVMMELLQLNWVWAHFISGFIIVVIFNLVFVFEYVTKYQKRKESCFK